MRTTIKSTIYLVESICSAHSVADAPAPLSKTAQDVTVILRIPSTTSKVNFMVFLKHFQRRVINECEPFSPSSQTLSGRAAPNGLSPRRVAFFWLCTSPYRTPAAFSFF